MSMDEPVLDPDMRLTRDEISGEEFEEEREALNKFLDWYEDTSESDGLPVRGTTFAILVTLDKLRRNYNLDIDFHSTDSGKQVSLLGKPNVSKVLEDFGETRKIPEEGGRTNRGALYEVEQFLEVLESTKLSDISEDRRRATLRRMMTHLVWAAGEYHERARVPVEYNPAQNATQIISRTLDIAESKAGAVAQHLVGAKLQIRLPDVDVENHAVSTADAQTQRRGDFQINDAVFHVTISPFEGHYEKCETDVRDGYRVYLLVRNDMRVAAEQTANKNYSANIAVQAIESFIGQNLDELSEFSKQTFKNRFKSLLELYNERVSNVESDPSLLIEIPENL